MEPTYTTSAAEAMKEAAIKVAKIEAETELFKADARKREAEINQMTAQVNKWIQDSIEDRRKSDREYARITAESEREYARITAESEREYARILERHRAETEKMAAERAKISRETFWYPVIAIAGAMGAGAALMGGAVLLLKYLTTP